MWFGPAQADGRLIETNVDLDGFARTVSGVSDIVPEDGGWWKIQPQDGPAFLVQPIPTRGNDAGDVPAARERLLQLSAPAALHLFQPQKRRFKHELYPRWERHSLLRTASRVIRVRW